MRTKQNIAHYLMWNLTYSKHSLICIVLLIHQLMRDITDISKHFSTHECMLYIQEVHRSVPSDSLDPVQGRITENVHCDCKLSTFQVLWILMYKRKKKTTGTFSNFVRFE